MTTKDGFTIAPHTLTFWLKDWTQRVEVRFSAGFGPLEGATLTACAPAASEVQAVALARVRAYFEREVDTRRWDGVDFCETVRAVRAELDAWMRSLGGVTVDLHIERVLAPPGVPCESPLKLQSRVSARDVSVFVTASCTLQRRSALAWATAGESDLVDWATRRFRSLCRRHVAPYTRAELRERLAALQRAIHDGFQSHLIEVGYDPHALVTRVELGASRAGGLRDAPVAEDGDHAQRLVFLASDATPPLRERPCASRAFGPPTT